MAGHRSAHWEAVAALRIETAFRGAGTDRADREGGIRAGSKVEIPGCIAVA